MSTPRWVLIPNAAEMLGYSRVAIEHKIKNGLVRGPHLAQSPRRANFH